MTISFRQLASIPGFKEAWQKEFMTRVENNYTKLNQDEEAKQIIQSVLEVQDFYNLESIETLAIVTPKFQTKIFFFLKEIFL